MRFDGNSMPLALGWPMISFPRMPGGLVAYAVWSVRRPLRLAACRRVGLLARSQRKPATEDKGWRRVTTV